ncbi:MAG: hypothetical protein N2645_09165 [Clostridia bacterium]|nr:hypothetical protein [Clostridia bacterium]
MKLEPIKKYKAGYPDRSFVLENPSVLKVMPMRWKSSAALGFVLSGLILSTLTACQKEEDTVTVMKSHKVAPVFVYGDGKVSYTHKKPEFKEPVTDWSPIPTLSYRAKLSRLVQNFFERPQPMYAGNYPGGLPGNFLEEDFMNEAKALSIVQVELLKNEIQLGVINETEKDTVSREVQAKDPMFKKGNHILELDGLDKNKKIGFEFVSVVDAAETEDGAVHISPNDKNYNVLDLSKTYREAIVEGTGETVVGVFYDPGKGQEENGVQKTPEELLKLQVKDFVDWLKAQGIG